MATTQTLTIPQGSDTAINFSHFDVDGFTPIDLSLASSVKLQARQWFDDPVADIDLALNDGITITGANTNIARVIFRAADTNAISFEDGRLELVYCLEFTIGGVTERSFQGTILLKRDVIHA